GRAVSSSLSDGTIKRRSRAFWTAAVSRASRLRTWVNVGGLTLGRSVLVLAWKSQSMRRTVEPSRTSAWARFVARELLPTPPLKLRTLIRRVTRLPLGEYLNISVTELQE